MDPLGFRFDVDAVIVDGTAHRVDCQRLSESSRENGVIVHSAGVHRALCCPRECPVCRPQFETLLSYQLAARPA